MNDEFQWSEFGSERGEHDPDFHFASLHSPTLKYKYIEKSNRSIDEGISEFKGKEKKSVQAYSSVSIFRDTMEYIEEFGIYLYSIINPDEGFIDTITRTETSDIKEMFEQLRDGNYQELLNDNPKFGNIEDFLKWAFGYDMFLDSEIDLGKNFDENEFTVDTKEEAVEKAITTIKTKLERISWYFFTLMGHITQ